MGRLRFIQQRPCAFPMQYWCGLQESGYPPLKERDLSCIIQRDVNCIKQIDRLHHHFHNVIAIGHPMGDVQKQIDLCRAFNP